MHFDGHAHNLNPCIDVSVSVNEETEVANLQKEVCRISLADAKEDNISDSQFHQFLLFV